MESTNGRFGPLLQTPWLDHITQTDLRSALIGRDNIWLDAARYRGFLRTVFNPLQDDHVVVRTQFLMAARKAAETVGFPTSTAQSLAAALREMESNIHEHSERSETGILAFQARPSSFEFVIADCGVGVLATLRDAPEFRDLTDHGRALHLALQENVSRHGRDPDHGNGFRDLFLGLADLNADLRFRTGDHALSISGPRPELKMARLSQKAPFQGFLASVHCHLARPSFATP
jgi:anti-sigma regulatory factor (Ser/Thr protein kinase)